MEENKAVVTKVCYMYARDSEHFKDLYQETLINIWQALPRFKKEAALSTWIYRITINTCISHSGVSANTPQTSVSNRTQ